MNLEEAEHLIHEMANADASARASKVYRAAAGIVLGALAAERAKREEAERERDDAISELCEAGESIGAERARSAALEAEVERLRELGVELVERFQTVLDNCAKYVDVAPGRERLREYLAVLSQSLTKEKKT